MELSEFQFLYTVIAMEELQKFDSYPANVYLHMACTSVSSSTYKAATFENICCITHITGWLAAHLEVVVHPLPHPLGTLHKSFLREIGGRGIFWQQH